MLTTHLLCARKEPLPRSRTQGGRNHPYCLQANTGTQEDARLVSLRVKKGVVRPFMELVVATLMPTDVEARRRVNFSRA